MTKQVTTILRGLYAVGESAITTRQVRRRSGRLRNRSPWWLRPATIDGGSGDLSQHEQPGRRPTGTGSFLASISQDELHPTPVASLG